MDGWREFYGNADDDTYVEGWDFRYGHSATSDSSHLWHIHLSENRDQTTSQTNKEALLSVLRGETVEQWLGAGAGGDGAVLLNCPYDADRLDLLYVGSTGEVMHRWYTSGGMQSMWTGAGGKENLGGVIIAGTLDRGVAARRVGHQHRRPRRPRRARLPAGLRPVLGVHARPRRQTLRLGVHGRRVRHPAAGSQAAEAP